MNPAIRSDPDDSLRHHEFKLSKSRPGPAALSADLTAPLRSPRGDACVGASLSSVTAGARYTSPRVGDSPVARHHQDRAHAA